MRNLGLAAIELAFALGAAIVPVRSEAIPAFARKYETSCLTCHSVYPRLTPFGEAFRRNGYRFPGVDSDYVKQNTVALGQEATKKTFPLSVWPASLPVSAPIAIGVNGQASWFPKSGSSVPRANNGTTFSLDDLVGEGHLWAGAALDDKITLWAEITLSSEGVDVEHAQMLFNDLAGPQHAVNLVVGKGFPTLTSFGPHSTYLGDARITTVPVTEIYGLSSDPFTLVDNYPGFELTGVLGGRFDYSAGVSAGKNVAGSTFNSENVYAHAGYKVGGMRLDGEGDKGPKDAMRPWAEDAITVDAFVYHSREHFLTPPATGTEPNTKSQEFDFQGKAEGIQLARLAALASRPGFPAVTGIADFTAHVSGNLGGEDLSTYQITFDGQGRDVTINGRPAGTVALVGKTENKQLNVTFTTGVLGPPQVVSAQVNLGSPNLAANIETTFTNADLTNLFQIAMPGSAVRVSGRANGTIKASGNLLDEDQNFSIAGLSGTASFSELNFRVEDVQLNATTPLVVRFTPSEITFSETRFTGPGTNIVLDGTLATATGGRQNLNVNGDLNLRVLNGASPDFFSSGSAEVAVRINGTFEDPRMIGTASLNNASVSVLIGNDRWTVANLKAALRFTANQAQIDSLDGTIGGGRVSATGGALLDGFTVSAFRINLHGNNVTVPFPPDFRSTLDADVEIRGSSREQLIGGVVNLRRTEYTKDIELADLINTRRESIEEGTEIELTRTALFAALRVEGRNALVVRNNLADLVGSVSLQLDGPVNDPTISGRITATSGTLNFRNDRYDITRALLDLPPSRNADPILNIQGESQIRGYRVIVGLTGPLSQPSANVRSEPALPQADVVSLITTGQLSSGDTSSSILSQSEVGAATSLLTDALINAPAQRATSKLFGLTRFEINPVIGGTTGSTPGARLTLGRRISKEVTVTYSTNVTSDPNQILALEYRVSDRLSFVAQYEQASTRRLSARTNNFSFEIRFRKRF